MSIMDKATQAVEARVSEKVTQDNLVGFDFAILIPVIIQLITSLLQDCLNQSTVDQVASSMKEGGFWARYAARRAVNQAAKEEGQKLKPKERRVLIDSLLEEMADTSQADCVSMIKEIQGNTYSWDVFA